MPDIKEYSCFAMGPGLKLESGTEIESTDAFECDGDFHNSAFERLVMGISCDSMTVCSDDKNTVCLITSTHNEEATRGYGLNAAFCFWGGLRNTVLDKPEILFELYDMIQEMDQYAFREAFQDENGSFYSVIEKCLEEYEKTNYAIAGADKLTVLALTEAAINPDRNSIFLLDTERKALCNSLRHIPLPMRYRISFAFPSFGNRAENLADVVICPAENPPELKTKVGDKTVIVSDREDFSYDAKCIGEYLFDEIKGVKIKKYAADETNYSDCLQDLKKLSGMITDEPPIVIENQDKKKKSFFGKNSGGKNAAEFSEESSETGIQKRYFDSSFLKKIKNREKRENHEWNTDALSAKMSVLIMVLSLVLYVLNNMEIIISDKIAILITLDIHGTMNSFCLCTFSLAILMLLVHRTIDREKA